MAVLRMEKSNGFFFEQETMAAVARELSTDYQQAEPFPNIVINNFMEESILDEVLQHFPVKLDNDSKAYSRNTENLKSSYLPENLNENVRSLFYAFNSMPFLKFLESLSGIPGLIPDPYFVGGGLHETLNGGHLSIHADFNLHKKLNLERRINVLIYLNRNWEPEYGGQLELWDSAMKNMVKRIDPIFNRAVIFNTTSESYHGQPDPITHPDNSPRRSIALYYYTATWSDSKRSHTTQFKIRSRTGDSYDYSVRSNEIIRDFLPPILLRGIKKIKTRKN